MLITALFHRIGIHGQPFLVHILNKRRLLNAKGLSSIGEKHGRARLPCCMFSPMSLAHIVLLLVAILMLLEALWGLWVPAHVRETVSSVINEWSLGPGSARSIFWTAALLFWAVAWLGNAWTHRALFFIGVFFVVAGEIFANSQYREKCFQCFLGSRTNLQVRFIYCGEAALAVVFFSIALGGY